MSRVFVKSIRFTQLHLKHQRKAIYLRLLLKGHRPFEIDILYAFGQIHIMFSNIKRTKYLIFLMVKGYCHNIRGSRLILVTLQADGYCVQSVVSLLNQVYLSGFYNSIGFVIFTSSRTKLLRIMLDFPERFKN